MSPEHIDGFGRGLLLRLLHYLLFLKVLLIDINGIVLLDTVLHVL